MTDLTANDYEEFYGKKVLLVLDGRSYDASNMTHQSNVSIQITAKLVSESPKTLKLEEIIILNHDYAQKRFNSGKIRKNYLIGLFLYEAQ